MTAEEINQVKKISIRGRFAYGLICLEMLKERVNQSSPELDLLIQNMWKITNTDKLGSWQTDFIENNPITLVQDYQLIKEGKVTFEQIGFETIQNEIEFESKISFVKLLKDPIPQLVDKLCQIANQNISAGCGEYSELTLEPTIELINIIDRSQIIKRPKIEIVEFSQFTENNGWGDKFEKTIELKYWTNSEILNDYLNRFSTEGLIMDELDLIDKALNFANLKTYEERWDKFERELLGNVYEDKDFGWFSKVNYVPNLVMNRENKKLFLAYINNRKFFPNFEVGIDQIRELLKQIITKLKEEKTDNKP